MRVRSRSNGKRLRVRKTISRKSTSVNEGRNGWIGEWLSFNNRRSNSLASKEILLSFVSPAPTMPIFLLPLWHSLDRRVVELSISITSNLVEILTQRLKERSKLEIRSGFVNRRIGEIFIIVSDGRRGSRVVGRERCFKGLVPRPFSISSHSEIASPRSVSILISSGEEWMTPGRRDGRTIRCSARL